MTQQNNGGFFVYVGTYTTGASEGIYVYHLDVTTGALEFSSSAAAGENPSFLAIHPQERYLYAVNEVSEYDGKLSGAVSAFSIDQTTGELTSLNQQSSGGPDPCHLTVDGTGEFVLAANFGGGSVCVLPIGDDGQLAEATDFVQHEGSSVNPVRQNAPHAHSIITDPANRYAFAADLGLDKILIYELDLTAGKLIPNNKPWAQVKGGAGPRHVDFHPDSKYAYVINELDSTFTVFTYDEANGTLNEIQTISTLPEDFEGKSYTADVHVHPSGKFVYGSNRGHDSIAIFKINENTGTLTSVDHESTQGEAPRGFGIDPTGTLLLAANQNTNTIVTFRINQQTGELTPTGHVTDVPSPVCLKFIPR